MKRNLWLLWGAGVGALNAVTAITRFIRRISFKNKVVVITGGSRGLGLVLARGFAKENAKLVLLARDGEELDAAKKELISLGVEVSTYFCDVTNEELVNATIQQILSEHGRIDVLVNNAGLIQVGPLDSMTVEDYRKAMDLHFFAPLYMVLAVVPHMKAQHSGRIVNITSIGGKVSMPHLIPYNASKFALAGLSAGLRAELMRHNVIVTTVVPGLMRTGSHVQAKFKGQNTLEYAWFSTLSALPVLSTAAENAAHEIIEACRYGEAERIITMPAQILVKFTALFPDIAIDVLSLVNMVLPGPGGIGQYESNGEESKSKLSPSPLTALADKQVTKNNEDISFDHPTATTVDNTRAGN